ncbi:MAG: hypothetical protein KBS66_06130 [Eubacterium sp.]|nr:hypothetical protein [Candidatus Colimonas fimequi]
MGLEMRYIMYLLLSAVIATGVFVVPQTVVSNADVIAPGKAEIKTISLSSRQEGTVNVRWARGECDGYQLQYADNSEFKSSISTTIKRASASSRSIHNLDKDKTYYFRVRMYRNGDADKIYGDWSEARSKEIELPKYVRKATKKATEAKAKTETIATTANSESDGESDTANMSANEKARRAAVDWAIAIAADDSFHYGRSKWAHHSGCYFCGTNMSKGSAKLKAGASRAAAAKTYCCNPFVTAAYHHGAGTSELDCRYKNKRVGLAGDTNKALKNTKNFKKIKKPSTIMKLEPGDILLTPTHCMLYAGDGKVVHAAHHDNGVQDAYWNSSITYGEISAKQWKRTSKIYRYLGTGKYS